MKRFQNVEKTSISNNEKNETKNENEKMKNASMIELSNNQRTKTFVIFVDETSMTSSRQRSKTFSKSIDFEKTNSFEIIDFNFEFFSKKNCNSTNEFDINLMQK